jgi:hypothetical protein
MKKRSVFVALSLAVGLFTGCGVSMENLTKEVQTSIEETWAKEPDFASARIKSFTLAHKGGNQYRGLLEAERDGEVIKLSLEVTYDGKTLMWEVVE